MSQSNACVNGARGPTFKAGRPIRTAVEPRSFSDLLSPGRSTVLSPVVRASRLRSATACTFSFALCQSNWCLSRRPTAQQQRNRGATSGRLLASCPCPTRPGGVWGWMGGMSNLIWQLATCPPEQRRRCMRIAYKLSSYKLRGLRPSSGNESTHWFGAPSAL